MKVLKILIVMLILIMSVGVVCAAESIADDGIGNDGKEILQTVQEDITTDDSTDILKTTQNDIYTASDDSFTNLTEEIKSKNVVDLTHDYKFNNGTDDGSGIVIEKDNFVLNGNGHIIDGNSQSRLFSISGNNITLNDLILINGYYKNCAGIRAVESTLTLNNVTFINNHAINQGGAIGLDTTTLICNNTKFIDSYAEDGPAILLMESEVKLYNSYITSKEYVKGSQIYLTDHTEAYIENTTFANIISTYAPALNIKSAKASIINSRFINLKGNISAGAIRTKAGGELYIENCEFENVTSSRNGGAIFADVAGGNDVTGNVTIIGSKFKDTYSEFGGAYVQLGGDFVLKNTEFISSHAKYDGGAVYLSYTNTEIDNCTFDSNGVSIIEGYPTYGGAIYCDMGTLNITESKFFNNVASAGSAIYAFDSSYDIGNSVFENNTNPIYSVFDKQINIVQSNVFVNDNNLSLNNSDYAAIMIGQGLQLVLLNNTVNTSTIPDKFDLRDYGWVSSVKNQAGMGACWTFGMTGTLESALLKAANITTDFSENNMQNTMLKYSKYGSTLIVEGGANCISTSYLLSWLGAFTQDVDTYDEVGKISPAITTQNDIHIQDVMFTPNNEIPNATQLKLAIMKYGSIDVAFYGQTSFDEINPYYNPETYAHYVNEYIEPTHAVSIIGWDDNYDGGNFLMIPPGNGAWIVKNSYGAEWGDNGFFYISYYDKSLLNSKDVTNYATSIIIENTEPYNKNYQYALMWGGDFKSGNQNVSYMSEFEALDDDLIAGVGTYFEKEGMDYTVEIYVNDELKLTQTGVSPYYGYRTIKLNEYMPIRKGDVFKAVITSESAPTVNLTSVRSHYTQNLSYISFDGEPMKDSYDLGYIVCLKVYTVAKPTLFELQEAIANSTENYMELNVDYEFNNGTDNGTGILISRDNFVINGNSHTIDAKNQSRIFNINANNITLSNLILSGGNAEKGGAIYTTGSLTLNNVTFIDCTVGEDGGAINWVQNMGSVSDSTFINCRAKNGGAIYYGTGSSGIISNCIFINCSAANDGGGIDYTTGSQGRVSDSSFINCSAKTGGAIYWNGNAGTVENSTFINSTAENGNAIFANNELRVSNSEFKSRSSANDRNTVEGGVVENCIFNGNELVKTAPELTLSVDDIEYGQTATISARLPDDAANNVTFRLVKGNLIKATKTTAVSKGIAIWEIPNLSIGVYTVMVSYEGDFNYFEANASAVMIVGPQVRIQQNVPAGSAVSVFLDFGEKIIDYITINVDGRIADVLDIDDGIVNQTIKTKRYLPGNHKVTFSYDGNKFDDDVLNYFDVKSNTFEPREHDMVLADEEIVVGEDMNTKDDGVLALEFPVNATGSLTVLIDGEPVESMDLQEEIEKAIKEFVDETGASVFDITTCILKIDLSKYGKGTHIITFEYSGDDNYQAFVKERNVTVNKKVDIIASNMNTVYTAGPTYTIKVYEANAPANKAAVSISMNGKIYITLYTASNGVASFKVSQTPGTYKLTISSLEKTITRALTVKHVVALKTVTVKKSAKKLVLQATLSKVNGKYLKNKKVTFKFNGKKYTAKTNKKGVAKVTIKSSVLKKLKVGKKVTYQATYIKDTVKKTVKVKK